MREKFAYGFIGKALSRLLQRTLFPNARAHWIQDAFAGSKTWASLKKKIKPPLPRLLISIVPKCKC